MSNIRVKSITIFLLFFLSSGNISAENINRWNIDANGGISWTIDGRIPHSDHIEMSGLKLSAVLRYGVDANGSFQLNRSLIWPSLRTIPNNTHEDLSGKIRRGTISTI